MYKYDHIHTFIWNNSKTHSQISSHTFILKKAYTRKFSHLNIASVSIPAVVLLGKKWLHYSFLCFTAVIVTIIICSSWSCLWQPPENVKMLQLVVGHAAGNIHCKICYHIQFDFRCKWRFWPQNSLNALHPGCLEISFLLQESEHSMNSLKAFLWVLLPS